MWAVRYFTCLQRKFGTENLRHQMDFMNDLGYWVMSTVTFELNQRLMVSDYYFHIWGSDATKIK